MATTVMKGVEVAKAMKEELIKKRNWLQEQGVTPRLTIVRVGARPDDLAYERGAKKRMEIIGIDCEVIELPEQITQAELEATFQKVNADSNVHGILLFRPLPNHLDEEPLKAMIDPRKDVDCMSPVNVAKVFAGEKSGFAPCTAEAVVEMLEHFQIPLEGKQVTLVGRSMVVGKPLAMLLLGKNATLTICHTKTKDLAKQCRQAEIVVAAAGKAAMITGDMLSEGVVVADVGINVDESGALCGDVDYNSAEEKASAISPVPGGVGSITTSVLAKHVLRSACYVNGLEA